MTWVKIIIEGWFKQISPLRFGLRGKYFLLIQYWVLKLTKLRLRGVHGYENHEALEPGVQTVLASTDMPATFLFKNFIRLV